MFIVNHKSCYVGPRLLPKTRQQTFPQPLYTATIKGFRIGILLVPIASPDY